MWHNNWREQIPKLLNHQWDIIIIGGGITGAGILLEASRRGLKTLLIEQRDFSWGTSSRSSKLVHGGFRYLKEGKVALTRASVLERENLLCDAANLVDVQRFAFADYQGKVKARAMFSLGLFVYDLLAGRLERHYSPMDEFQAIVPNINNRGLLGGLCFSDAKTDDARLVMRVLQEALEKGGVAINYMAAKDLLKEDGKVVGVIAQDSTSVQNYEVRARAVINATGAWADGMRKLNGMTPKLRRLRGSHLILPQWRLPLSYAIGFMHPKDKRLVFAYPWEGVTLVGTTDEDHGGDMSQEPSIAPFEVEYLLAALAFQFPDEKIMLGDIISTYAGVRPVIDTKKSQPSQESRDHAVWLEDGLLTVTGGKLTTFRLMALDALKALETYFPKLRGTFEKKAILNPILHRPVCSTLNHPQVLRLTGRYGTNVQKIIDTKEADDLERIRNSNFLWAELRWAAKNEAVVHLEDLMLRRSRLGLVLRDGGRAIMPHMRKICQSELGFSDERWLAEETAYLDLWRKNYFLPPEMAGK